MTNPKSSDNVKEIELTQTQLNFLEFCKKFAWGKLEVTVQNGEPVYSKEIERTHQHRKV